MTIKSLIRALIIAPFIFPLHAEVLIDAVQTGSQGYECYQIIDGNELVLSRHNQERKAIAACTTAKTTNLEGEYRVRSTGYIRIVVSSDAQAQLIPGVVNDPGYGDEPPTPPVGDESIALGDNGVNTGTESAGVYTLTARGTVDPDDGTWLVLDTVTTGQDVQVIWRAASAITGATVGDFSGMGIQFRVATDNDKLVMSWWPDAGQCRFKYRDTDMGTVVGGILGSSSATLPHYCAMTYDAGFPRVQMWESSVGGTSSANWTLVDTVSIDLGASFDVGAYCLGGQANAVTVTCTIDNVSISNVITLANTPGTTDPPLPVDSTDDTYWSGLDLTYNGSWKTVDAVVAGFNWTSPPDATGAAFSGVFQNNCCEEVGPYFQGNRLKKIKGDWDVLEPTDGNYDFSVLTDELNSPSPGFDGVHFDVRGNVVKIRDCADTSDEKLSQWTAPSWLQSPVYTPPEDCKNGVVITNLLISNATVKQEWADLVAAMGSSFAAHPRLFAVVMHGVSPSQGEEWTGSQAGTSAAVAAQQQLIQNYVSEYGAYAWKLAWLKTNPSSLYTTAVIDGGTGIRGGRVENWLTGIYTTPGTLNMDAYGMSYDNEGHIITDDDFYLFDRHFMEENEAYRGAIQDVYKRNYRHANIRGAQMRYRTWWIPDNDFIDPQNTNWLSLQLGRDRFESHEAFVWPMRTWNFYGGQTRQIHNLERYLYQRDAISTNVIPSPGIFKRDHGRNATQNKQLDPSNWNVNVCKQGESIGIAVDDDFITGAKDVVALITYYSVDDGTFTLEYDNGGGYGSGQRSLQMVGANELRTVNFRMTDFRANATGYGLDFSIDDPEGNTPICMIRLIKCDTLTCGP